MTVLQAEIERLPQARLRDPAYERFARAVFGASRWDEHVCYCRWLYERNPHAEADGPLPIYICRDGRAIVGQLGIIPVRIVLGGAAMLSGWCVDFFILPSHQRRGLGRRLLTAAHADFPLLMSLGQTDASYALFQRCGWQPAGTLRTYKRLLRPLRCLSRRAFRTIGGEPRSGRPGRSSPSTLAVDWASAAVDLESETRICRDPDYLKWRYSDVPNLTYRIQACELGGATRTFAVWRAVGDDGGRRGILVDLVYPADLPDSALSEMLRSVVEAMRADRIDVLECQTSDHRVLAALPGGPFATQQRGVRFIYGGDDSVAWPRVAADGWRLYSGDCDIDTLHARGAVL